ncbi:flippase, partial [Planococcus glaciei]
MNEKAKNLMKNMSYTVSSNLIMLIVSTLIIFVLPKILGVEEYGYWQLYMFYSTYVGLSQLGWNDGIYLRYGGTQYNNLDKKLFFSQFIMLSSSQIVLGILIWIYTVFFIADLNRDFIIIMVSISMVILNTRVMLLYILQATNRIKDYALIILIDRLVFILLVLIFLLAGVKDFKVIIYADLIGKFFSLIYSMV